MKILVIGSGGREHALAWKLAQSLRVHEVIVAPGNAGTARERKCRNIEIAATDIDALIAFAREQSIGLTVVGPEAPLVAGVVDRFGAAGLRIFGPCAQAARLEGSKAFAKDFMARHGIPTADHAVFSEIEPALAHIAAAGAPIVVKADGLAAGKGVVVAHTRAEAEAAVRGMLAGNAFGDAGSQVVIEQCLQGEEASFICIVDGSHALPMATSQDHKRIGEGDSGPNTGGMGAYSPAPVVTAQVHARVLREVIEPTVRGMAADGTPYTGFLYAGLMITPEGAPRVIEFNVRFGDPETQPVMLRLRSDLLDLLEAALAGRLDRVEADWDARAALAVVIAAEGYPGRVRSGGIVTGLATPTGADGKLFHAGTRIAGNGIDVETCGGRVLAATALGASVREAAQRAYAIADAVSFEGAYCRRDIGHRAIAREG